MFAKTALFALLVLTILISLTELICAREPRLLGVDEKAPSVAHHVLDAIFAARYYKEPGFTDADEKTLSDFDTELNTPTRLLLAGNPKPSIKQMDEARELELKMAVEMLPRVRAAISETAYVNSIRRANRDKLEYELRGSHGVKGDPSYLTTEFLERELSLTAEQRAFFEKEAKAHNERTRHRVDAFLDELDQDFKVRYRDLLTELNEEQKAEFKDLFGQPYMWEALRKTEKDLLKNDLLTSAAYYRRAEWIMEFRGDARFSSEDPEQLDYLWYSLASKSQVWDELELTDKQREEFEAYVKQAGKFSTMTSETSKARLLGMLNGIYEVPERVEEFLLKHQVKRLAQLEFQLRVSDNYSTLGLTNSIIREALKLDAATVKTLEAKGAKYDEERDRKIKEFEQWRNKERQRTVDSMKEELDDQQLANYELNINPVYYVDKEGVDGEQQRDEKRNKQK